MSKNLIARTALFLAVVGATWTVDAAPVRSTATARVGARIIAAPQMVSLPQLPPSVQLSAKDVERGYVVVSLEAASPRLAVASGDRDESQVTPAIRGAVNVDSSARSEKVEIVLHAE